MSEISKTVLEKTPKLISYKKGVAKKRVTGFRRRAEILIRFANIIALRTRRKPPYRPTAGAMEAMLKVAKIANALAIEFRNIRKK